VSDEHLRLCVTLSAALALCGRSKFASTLRAAVADMDQTYTQFVDVAIKLPQLFRYFDEDTSAVQLLREAWARDASGPFVAFDAAGKVGGHLRARARAPGVLTPSWQMTLRQAASRPESVRSMPLAAILVNYARVQALLDLSDLLGRIIEGALIVHELVRRLHLGELDDHSRALMASLPSASGSSFGSWRGRTHARPGKQALRATSTATPCSWTPRPATARPW
jgi:hypothetical protein